MAAHRKGLLDHAGKLRQPFKVAPGGYMSFYDARRRKWIDDYGTHDARKFEPIDGYAARAARGNSRKGLRALPRQQWKRSTR